LENQEGICLETGCIIFIMKMAVWNRSEQIFTSVLLVKSHIGAEAMGKMSQTVIRMAAMLREVM